MAKLIHFLLLCCLSSIVLALPEKCASLERQIALYLPHVTNTTHSTQIRFPVSLACCNCANRILQELLDTNCTPSLAIAVESIGCGLDLVSLQQKVLPMPRQELFERYPVADIVCCVIIAAVSGLAVASGIGGGGIFVPLLMVLLRFPANIAAGMSQFLIFGGGVAGIILNLRERHPTSNIPLVDTSILLYFAPAMMLGVQLGVVANHAIPDAIIRIIFITTILAGMYSTVSKAVASWRADRAAISGDAVRLEDDELGDEMHNASCPVARRESSATVTAGLNDAFDRLQDPQYDGCDNAIDSPHVHPGDCRQDPTPKTAAMATQDPGRCCERYTKIDSAIPVKAYGSLVALWVVTTVLLLYRGGGLNRLLGGGASGLFHVDPCGTLYWVLWGCNIAVFFAFTATSGVKIWRNQRSRRAVGYAFADGTLVLTPLTVLGLGTFTALSGILAGVVGTGAAMLLAPLLMRSGVLPSVRRRLLAWSFDPSCPPVIRCCSLHEPHHVRYAPLPRAR